MFLYVRPVGVQIPYIVVACMFRNKKSAGGHAASFDNDLKMCIYVCLADS
jgi:hypothetical protein